MNSKTVSALIDKLSDKELTFGCKVKVGDYERYIVNLYQETNGFNKSYKFSDHIIYTEEQIKFDKGIIVLGHPVLIGDVLKRISIRSLEETEIWASRNFKSIVSVWESCGFTKSLNEIMEDSGFEEQTWTSNPPIVVEQLKDPSARALFEFLGDIFLT